jgi:hypothetical protein
MKIFKFFIFSFILGAAYSMGGFPGMLGTVFVIGLIWQFSRGEIGPRR